MDLPAGVAPSLLTMPLHAITEVYGEAGLRERFRLETDALAEPGRTLVRRAFTLAADLHRDDRRVREPYVNHLLRVAIRILRYYGIDDPDVLAAAVLHDAVEDHPAELAALAGPGGTGAGTPGVDTAGVATHDGVGQAALQRAAVTVLAERFNGRIAALVAAVTNPVYDPRRDTYEQYREHVAASLEREPWARVIKISDFTDNGVGVIHTVGPKVNSAATKYRPLVPVLRELVNRADTPLSEAARRHVLAQLDLAEERVASILDR